MTLFSPRYMSMSGELKSSRSRAASKRSTYDTDLDLDYDSYQEDYYDRVYDYQLVPASLSPRPEGLSPAKRFRSSSSSSRHRRSRDRTHSRSSRAHSSSSSTAKLGMEELQVIKKELTLIKTQIDGLLDSLDRMDAETNDHKAGIYCLLKSTRLTFLVFLPPPSAVLGGSSVGEDSPVGSPYCLSTCSPEHSASSLSPVSSYHRSQKENLDLREPDDYHHTMRNHSYGLEDEI
ncbi:RNA-binding Raly-like protein [Neosynchiropus ocellatus]